MQHTAKTKIVATIGPSSWDDNVVKSMINAGMSIARINASFADFNELTRVSTQIRSFSSHVALLLDTMGHKIRVTGFEEDKSIQTHDRITLASEGAIKDPNVIQVTYPTLAHDLTRGAKILLDDGNISLVVEDIIGEEVFCNVTQGGILKRRKTVNIPGIHLNFPKLSEKDFHDIRFAVENGFEYVSASFVRDIYDVQKIREAMGETETKLICKIEDYEGVQNFEQILNAADGIMIARGDLGVELPIEQIPIFQKKFVQLCREAGKPVIVATQMLESMKENIRPTRAEVSDVVNAVLDGADALMLSAETSTGKHPIEAIDMMKRAIIEAEKIQRTDIVFTMTEATDTTDNLCIQAVKLVDELGLAGVIDLTKSGKTTSSLSRHTFNGRIWSVTNNPKLIRQLNLHRGVIGAYIDQMPSDRDSLIKTVVTAVYSRGDLLIDDSVVVISGSTINPNSINDSINVVKVKDCLL